MAQLAEDPQICRSISVCLILILWGQMERSTAPRSFGVCWEGCSAVPLLSGFLQGPACTALLDSWPPLPVAFLPWLTLG